MSSGFEPDVRQFLKRIIQTISAGLLFLLLHMTFGLYFNWAFFEGSIRLGNMVYYIIFLVSLGGLVYYYYRLWKGKL
jgi:NADH:ubiquinone oxidoreductase subunit 3 (subunit A)